MKLREEFAEELRDEVTTALNYPCSMLEMLIGIARRMEDILFEPEEEDQTERWFWEILGNIGLDKCTDSRYGDDYGRAKIDDMIDMILSRTYKRNGQGGLFPLKRSKKNQRKVEIWYQLSAYLNENYFICGN